MNCPNSLLLKRFYILVNFFFNMDLWMQSLHKCLYVNVYRNILGLHVRVCVTHNLSSFKVNI